MSPVGGEQRQTEETISLHTFTQFSNSVVKFDQNYIAKRKKYLVLMPKFTKHSNTYLHVSNNKRKGNYLDGYTFS